jgi:hypothetical protein
VDPEVAGSKPVTHPIQTCNAVIQITETFNFARKSWLKWADEHVEVVWLASWSPEKIMTLLWVVNLRDLLVHNIDRFTYSSKVE